MNVPHGGAAFRGWDTPHIHGTYVVFCMDTAGIPGYSPIYTEHILPIAFNVELRQQYIWIFGWLYPVAITRLFLTRYWKFSGYIIQFLYRYNK